MLDEEILRPLSKLHVRAAADELISGPTFLEQQISAGFDLRKYETQLGWNRREQVEQYRNEPAMLCVQRAQGVLIR